MGKSTAVLLLGRFLFIAAVLLDFTAILHSGTRSRESGRATGPNYMIHPSTTTQTEVLITAHPTNPNVLFASANTIRFQPSFFISEGIYVTTDGGSSWYGNDTCTGEYIQFHGGEPAIAIDRNGRFIIIRKGRPDLFPGLYSHFSTDAGITWSMERLITTDDLEFAAAAASDVNPSSTYYGRTYAVWVRFAPPYPVVFSYTDDGAATWSDTTQMNSPSQRCSGGDIVIGPDGKVHVCWAVVDDTSPYTEIAGGFASSTNGGTTWTVLENAFDMNGIRGVLSSKQNIRVNGIPRIAVDKTGGARDGWLYIVSTQKNLTPAGIDPDIILNRSTDGGTTWSSGIRVNQDLLNNGKIQYFPAIHVDDSGGVNIIYYDDRNTTSDSSGVFLSRSTDGGNTWSDVEISDHNFRPGPIGGLGQGYQGDNIGLTSANNTLWPVWMDNSSGIYQIWTVPISLSPTGIDDRGNNILPTHLELEQNYPNPFNSTTSIGFRLPAGQAGISNFSAQGGSANGGGFVSLKVYNILGQEIASLVDEEFQPGRYEIEWNAGEFPSGMYFYRLSVRGFSETKKMIFIK